MFKLIVVMRRDNNGKTRGQWIASWVPDTWQGLPELFMLAVLIDDVVTEWGMYPDAGPLPLQNT